VTRSNIEEGKKVKRNGEVCSQCRRRWVLGRVKIRSGHPITPGRHRADAPQGVGDQAQSVVPDGAGVKQEPMQTGIQAIDAIDDGRSVEASSRQLIIGRPANRMAKTRLCGHHFQPAPELGIGDSEKAGAVRLRGYRPRRAPRSLRSGASWMRVRRWITPQSSLARVPTLPGFTWLAPYPVRRSAQHG